MCERAALGLLSQRSHLQSWLKMQVQLPTRPRFQFSKT